MVECIVPTEFDIRALPEFKKKLESFQGDEALELDFSNVESMDAAAAQFLSSLEKYVENQGENYSLRGMDNKIVQRVIAQICIQIAK